MNAQYVEGRDCLRAVIHGSEVVVRTLARILCLVLEAIDGQLLIAVLNLL